MQSVPIGVPGELHIGGVQVARGYVNRPELTKERFISDPFSDNPQARLYKTGDLCRYLPDGNIEYLGRNDFQVKIRGFRIEVGEIESVLGRHPAVHEVVVLAREDDPGNKRLIAYLVAKQPAPGIDELRDFLKQKLPDYMVPAAFVILDAFPLTFSGKVDRRALPSPEAKRQTEQAYAPPKNKVEKIIAGIWRNILNLNEIGVHDNFFDLGGNSLLLVRMQTRLRESFTREIPITEIFRYPTVAMLAEFFNRQSGNDRTFNQVYDSARKQREALIHRRQINAARRWIHE
jgi:acyl carrier protein